MNQRSGLVLVIVGSVLLAHNFNLIQWAWIRQWWPALLIFVGLWGLLRPDRFDHPGHPGQPDRQDRPNPLSGGGGGSNGSGGPPPQA